MKKTIVSALSLFWLMAASCAASHVDLGDPEANVLQVAVVSDFVPVREVATVQVALLEADGAREGRTLGRFEERTLRAEESLSRGLDVAAFEGLDPGNYTIRVTFLRSNGEQVTQNRVIFEKPEGSMKVTVYVPQDCVSVSCEAGSAVSSACLAGRCVDPRCSPETPEHCPDGYFPMDDAEP